ncbi:amidase [Paraburkholderia haematera]|jgi:Asp-tRNAAsn/Glu-tRNAGln amidotransferase A subunit and related amidases|uniref:1-carboxybiuret hydrolase subunit AtzE n=1 Tax=Paraburkholderia haematera TaxID=2793077 RepID=A0ABM8SH38_9BURK|nr:amidase family protein [Paraburkholderia haematera]CAE6809321.1 1-carboxybiuret hydrolase subunit AtzE [Paraburkholderia haematera]
MAKTIVEEIVRTIDRASADEWNCMSQILRDRALQEAARLDSRATAGLSVPPLAGMPYVVKNLFDVKGIRTLAGGPTDDSIAVADQDAWLVRRLADAGAILLGTAHMDEYAYGFLGDNPHHGRVINPMNRELYTGGSSSGSAVAVAADIVPFAVGSDTNGSVRVPAAFCGIFSLKPTYGGLQLTGSMPLAPSLDHAGILACSLDTLASVWFALNPADSSLASHGELVPGFATGDYRHLSSAPVREAFAKVRSEWPESPDLALTHIEESLAAASLLTAFEAVANHSARLRNMPSLYSDSIAERLSAAASIRMTDYELARRAQDRLGRSVRAVFDADDVDVIVAPVVPINALVINQANVMLNGNEVKAADAAGLFTRPFSLTGLPVLTIPAAHGHQKGPRTAVQLVGRAGEESTLFTFAREFLRRVG